MLALKRMSALNQLEGNQQGVDWCEALTMGVRRTARSASLTIVSQT
jgi:hypothetical protein